MNRCAILHAVPFVAEFTVVGVFLYLADDVGVKDIYAVYERGKRTLPYGTPDVTVAHDFYIGLQKPVVCGS